LLGGKTGTGAREGEKVKKILPEPTELDLVFTGSLFLLVGLAQSINNNSEMAVILRFVGFQSAFGQYPKDP